MPVVTNEPRSKGGFALGDYVEVKDRIRMFYAAYPDGRLVTDRVEMWMDDGTPRVVVKALAYRTVDDPLPGVGWSWLGVPGKTPYTNGSEIENCETSAWGRAIGALGIALDKSIASGDEIRNKAGESVVPAPEKRDDGSLIGTGELAKDFLDFLPKPGPEGPVIAFKLVSPDGGIKVIAKGDLAAVLPAIKDEIIGKRVSCWGRVRDETFVKPATKPGGRDYKQTYQVLDLERLRTESGTLPMLEAPSIPAFKEDDLSDMPEEWKTDR